MTIGELIGALPKKSIVDWEENDEEIDTEEYLEDFMEDNGYAYRTRDLEIKDRPGESLKIEIVPTPTEIEIKIRRTFL